MPEEKAIGQRFVVDVVVEADYLQAAREDDLAGTVDYVVVNKIVEEEVAKRAKLIENVALRIAERILDETISATAEVKVCKPGPPINGDVRQVCVTVTL